jgi:hypothetical protein
MVLDVAQRATQLLVDVVLLESVGQILQHGEQGTGGTLEAGELAGKRVDPPRHGRVLREHCRLDLADVGLDTVSHRLVLVDYDQRPESRHQRPFSVPGCNPGPRW